MYKCSMSSFVIKLDLLPHSYFLFFLIVNVIEVRLTQDSALNDNYVPVFSLLSQNPGKYKPMNIWTFLFDFVL